MHKGQNNTHKQDISPKATTRYKKITQPASIDINYAKETPKNTQAIIPEV